MGGLETVAQVIDIIQFILIWFWWAIILVWLIACKLRWKKWPLEAIIYEKRGENLVKTNDRAGRYKDPYTGLIGYKLQKAGDSIPVVNFDGVVHNNAQHTTLFERLVNLIRGNAGTIHLFRYGSKQYKPIKIKTAEGKLKTEYREIKNPDGTSSMIQVYVPFDPRSKLGVLEFEVVDWDNMNQMTLEWKASLERRQKAKEFWKQIVIPAIIIGATVIFCIVMIKFGYDYATNISKANAPQETPKADKPNIPVISDVIPG